MPPINKIKITKFKPNSLGVNPELVTDIHSIYPFTAL
jgi:hypothetical protein